MTSAFYFDAHVPRAIARGLRRREVDVLTAQEDGAMQSTDPEILNRATALDRLVFTMDQDFLVEAARRSAARQTFSTVVFARPHEITIGRCIRDLELIARLITPEERQDQVLYLPL